MRLGHARRRRGQRDRPADPRDYVRPRVPHRGAAHLRRLGLHVERHPESGHSGSGPGGVAGTCSYLFYYKGISVIGAARGMALNISYSAWAVLFGLILLGTVPGPVEIVCCIAILCGTILAACDWGELFGTKKAEA